MLAIGCTVAIFNRKVHGYKEDEHCMKRLIKTGSNGKTLLSVADSDESDIEYQQSLRP
jgi:hypothetical protein